MSLVSYIKSLILKVFLSKHDPVLCKKRSPFEELRTMSHSLVSCELIDMNHLMSKNGDKQFSISEHRTKLHYQSVPRPYIHANAQSTFHDSYSEFNVGGSGQYPIEDRLIQYRIIQPNRSKRGVIHTKFYYRILLSSSHQTNSDSSHCPHHK